jgi:hypothetical protein
MLAEWAARDEQSILPTSTNPCIVRAAGTRGFNLFVAKIDGQDQKNHVKQK